MDLDKIKLASAQAAIEKMMGDGYFSICSVDKINAMLGTIPDKEAYRILTVLHCVNFRDLPPEVAASFPELLRRCIFGTNGLAVASLAPVFSRLQSLAPAAGTTRRLPS